MRTCDDTSGTVLPYPPICTINKELTAYNQLLSVWLAHVAEQLKNEQRSLIPLPNADTLVQSFEQPAIESSAYNRLLAASIGIARLMNACISLRDS